MAAFELKTVDSAEWLRSIAEPWDRLWSVDAGNDPIDRAEPVALWLDHFAHGRAVRILTVWDGETLLGSLPLVGPQKPLGLVVGRLPESEWLSTGTLMLDPQADQSAVLNRLIDGIEACHWALFRFDFIRSDQPAWQALGDRLLAHGAGVEWIDRWEEGTVDTTGSFDALMDRLPKNLRKSLKKRRHHLDETGEPLRFRFEKPTENHDLEKLLRRIFVLERQGWKGEEGSSVLQTPGVFEFYLALSRQLARWGALRVSLLEEGDDLVAYEWGWIGKRTYHSVKVSYHPRYQQFGPGHLLREEIARHLCADPDVDTYAFDGELTEALREWSTDLYTIRRLTCATGQYLGRIGWLAYRASASTVRTMRSLGHKTNS